MRKNERKFDKGTHYNFTLLYNIPKSIMNQYFATEYIDDDGNKQECDGGMLRCMTNFVLETSYNAFEI